MPPPTQPPPGWRRSSWDALPIQTSSGDQQSTKAAGPLSFPCRIRFPAPLLSPAPLHSIQTGTLQNNITASLAVVSACASQTMATAALETIKKQTPAREWAKNLVYGVPEGATVLPPATLLQLKVEAAVAQFDAAATESRRPLIGLQVCRPCAKGGSERERGEGGRRDQGGGKERAARRDRQMRRGKGQEREEEERQAPAG